MLFQIKKSLLIFWQALLLALLSVSYSAYAVVDDTQNLSYEDLFHLEFSANPIMLGDQKTVIYERHSMNIMADNKRINLWTVQLDGSEHLPFISDEHNHYSPTLSDNRKKLAYISTRSGSAQLYVHDIASNTTIKVTDVSSSPSNISFSPDGKHIAFTMFTPTIAKPKFSLGFKPKGANWADDAQYIDNTLFQRDGSGMKASGNTHLYIVPTIGGTPRQITHGQYDFASSIIWGKDSQSVLMSANIRDDREFDIFNTDIVSIELNTGKYTAITHNTGPENVVALSPNGQFLAFTGFDDNGKSNQLEQLFVMNIANNNIRSLTPALDRAINDVQWSADSQSLYISYDDRGEKLVAQISMSGELTVLSRTLGGQSIGRPYTSGDYVVTDAGEVVFTHSTGISPADLAVLSDDKLTMLTDLNSDILGHKALAVPELITIESSVDEQELMAWIVKPPQFDPKKQYPLILEIHGGPHTAYGPEFSTEVQMFAAAGYVVVYGNPRGSTSQGAEFANLIDKNYPSQDYHDLMNMVDAVIDKGYIDTDNLFVTGGSGGGVLTAWIIGNTDRFAAAVVAKPVINWVSMIGTSDIYTFMTKYWFTDLPWNDIDQYWQRSPLRLVGNVTTPTMVLTGELDIRTPMAESEQYYGALRLQKVDSAMVRIQGAYHGIAVKPSNLARKIGHILTWFDKYRTTQEVVEVAIQQIDKVNTLPN